MTAFEQRLRDGEPVTGQWLSIGHPAVAELCAPESDFVVVDTEHAPTGVETVTDVVRAVEASSDAAALVRVAWNDQVAIKRVLDAGPAGVVVPMVETAEEAREAVAAVSYPPAGVRGIAASRANDYGRTLDAAVESESDPITVVQVESAQAVENVPDIATVDGVDALLVGPADLSGSLGVFGEYDSDRFCDAVADVLAAGEAAGTPVGTLATSEADVERWAGMGFDYQIVGVDASYLTQGAAAARETYEDVMR